MESLSSLHVNEAPKAEILPKSLTTSSASGSGGSTTTSGAATTSSGKPHDLEQHIKKLISQNAAIIETLDPLWSKKYASNRHHSTSSIPDANHHLALGSSRLQSALLGQAAAGNNSISGGSGAAGGAHAASTRVPPVLLVTPPSSAVGHHRHSMPRLLEVPSLESSSCNESAIKSNHVPAAGTEAGQETAACGSLVRNLLTSKNPLLYPNHSNAGVICMGKKRYAGSHLPDHLHPENPEKSVIKDLLLKAREKESSSPPSSSSSSSCSSSRSPTHHMDANGNASSSMIMLHACPTCKTSFRDKNNLDAHQMHYCDPSGISASSCSISGTTSTMHNISSCSTLSPLVRNPSTCSLSPGGSGSSINSTASGIHRKISVIEMNPSVLHQRLTTDQRSMRDPLPLDQLQHQHQHQSPGGRERSSLGTILKKTLERREKRKISEPIFYSNRHAIINAGAGATTTTTTTAGSSAVPFCLSNGLVAHNNGCSSPFELSASPLISKTTTTAKRSISDVDFSDGQDDPMTDPFKQQVTMMLERTKEKTTKLPSDQVPPVPVAPTVITITTSTSTSATSLTPVCVPFAVSSGGASSIVSAMEICSSEGSIPSLSLSPSGVASAAAGAGLHKEQGEEGRRGESVTKVKQALQILPDYLPHLTSSSSSSACSSGMTASGSATRITLMGPIVFPVLERILSEDKDMIEFQVKDPSSEIHVKGSSPSSSPSSSLLQLVNITPTPVLLSPHAAAAAAASRNSPVLVMQPPDDQETNAAAAAAATTRTAKSEADDDCAMNVDADAVSLNEGENVSIRLQGEEDRDTGEEKDECEEAKVVTAIRNDINSNNSSSSSKAEQDSNPDGGDRSSPGGNGSSSSCSGTVPVRIKVEEVDNSSSSSSDDDDGRDGEERELFPPQTTSEGANQRSRPTSLAFLSPTGTSASAVDHASSNFQTTTTTSVTKAAKKPFACSDSENLSSDSFSNSCSSGSSSNHLNPAFHLIASNIASPDTPRPEKSILQQYLNGHAYTYIGLKTSTRSTYCCIYRPQPMFVTQETDCKLSMYSNWRTSSQLHDSIMSDVTPRGLLSSYDSNMSRFKDTIPTENPAYYVLAGSATASPTPDLSTMTTDSQYWLSESKKRTSLDESLQMLVDDTNRKMSNCESATDSMADLDEFPFRKISEDRTSSTSFDSDGDPNQPKRVKIFEGGFKSSEDYTYVRGRGRGKYVCEECGIRCKKPSMLKKHIRTHTDLRPYSCRHCAFAFKTKGNLTKHMKSKAHHKKCVELGIIPVPIMIDDSQIDSDALAKQEAMERNCNGGHLMSDGSEMDDDEDDDIESDDDEGVPIPLVNNNSSNYVTGAVLNNGISNNSSLIQGNLNSIPNAITASAAAPAVPTCSTSSAAAAAAAATSAICINRQLSNMSSNMDAMSLMDQNRSARRTSVVVNNNSYSSGNGSNPNINNNVSKNVEEHEVAQSLLFLSGSWTESNGSGGGSSSSSVRIPSSSIHSSPIRMMQQAGNNPSLSSPTRAVTAAAAAPAAAVTSAPASTSPPTTLMRQKVLVVPEQQQQQQQQGDPNAVTAAAAAINATGTGTVSSVPNPPVKRKISILETTLTPGSNWNPYAYPSRTRSFSFNDMPIRSRPGISSLHQVPCLPTFSHPNPAAALSQQHSPPHAQQVHHQHQQQQNKQSPALTHMSMFPIPMAISSTASGSTSGGVVAHTQSTPMMPMSRHSPPRVAITSAGCIQESSGGAGMGKQQTTAVVNSSSFQGHPHHRHLLLQQTPDRESVTAAAAAASASRGGSPLSEKRLMIADQGSDEEISDPGETATTTGKNVGEQESEASMHMRRFSTSVLRSGTWPQVDAAALIRRSNNMNGKAAADEEDEMPMDLSRKNSMDSTLMSIEKDKKKKVKSLHAAATAAAANAAEEAADDAMMDDGSVVASDGVTAFRPRQDFMPIPLSSGSEAGEGKCVCTFCNEVFPKPSALRLHVYAHYIERPYRCNSCAVSFRTSGHLKKHKRSTSHMNKLNMNKTFGTPSTDNPRPFKCSDCKVAFRIHGHLAKHLRSKLHIMKLECLNKLPFGMYAEMERTGLEKNLAQIDTTNCENSLLSVQSLSIRMSQQPESTLDISSLKYQDLESVSDGEDVDDDDDEGIPDDPAMMDMDHLSVVAQSSPAKKIKANSPNSLRPSAGLMPAPRSPIHDLHHLHQQQQLQQQLHQQQQQQQQQHRERSISFSGTPASHAQQRQHQHDLFQQQIMMHQRKHFPNIQEHNQRSLHHQLPLPERRFTVFSTEPSVIARQAALSQQRSSLGSQGSSVASSAASSLQSLSSSPSSSSSSSSASIATRSNTCVICQQVFKSAKFLQVHLYTDHTSKASSISDQPSPLTQSGTA